MNSLENVGNTIFFLRKKMKYTQKNLADRMGVSDKAVSKWERGLALPDVSCLSKLSIILDSDVESILNGNVVINKNKWNGLLIFDDSSILADEMIYDKPIISYLISYFLLVGINTVFIKASENNILRTKKLFNNGENYGISIVYKYLSDPIIFDEECKNIMIVFNKDIIYGVDQTRFFKKAMNDTNRITILSLPREKEDDSIRFDENKKITGNKFIKTEYNYYHIPIIFLPKNKINLFYSKSFNVLEKAYTEFLDRGFIDIPIREEKDIENASQFVFLIEKYCEMKIYSLEEIAWRRGLIDEKQFKHLIDCEKNMDKKVYLARILERMTEK